MLQLLNAQQTYLVDLAAFSGCYPRMLHIMDCQTRVDRTWHFICTECITL
jgi:hypothetical protein